MSFRGWGHELNLFLSESVACANALEFVYVTVMPVSTSYTLYNTAIYEQLSSSYNAHCSNLQSWAGKNSSLLQVPPGVARERT